MIELQSFSFDMQMGKETRHFFVSFYVHLGFSVPFVLFGASNRPTSCPGLCPRAGVPEILLLQEREVFEQLKLL